MWKHYIRKIRKIYRNWKKWRILKRDVIKSILAKMMLIGIVNIIFAFPVKWVRRFLTISNSPCLSWSVISHYLVSMKSISYSGFSQVLKTVFYWFNWMSVMSQPQNEDLVCDIRRLDMNCREAIETAWWLISQNCNSPSWVRGLKKVVSAPFIRKSVRHFCRVLKVYLTLKNWYLMEVRT